ncbi:hypothetical protein EYB26_008648 [Talaromyces marneffei]|uniref:uncharacterized protein n=1 Tax=Talaromyces marneffei TaxID=37727 RepID=UPI0012A82505|nr:uncharacterized protein EYB26_008648 [Talaromyces marneffei]QGA20938.1 hypothetical protein EYB26_008648 [Talaromyces marneffei]
MQHFAQDQPALYNLIQDRIGEIREVVDVDSWDTWLNRRPKDKTNKWFRRCKAYLPRFRTVKSLATSLSNLDPHHLAPYVTTGVFVFIELCFESVDPSMRDKAMTMLLKTSIIISKWVDREADLRRMKKGTKSQDVEKIEQQLPKLYFDSLMLISSIYESGRTRSSRLKANLISEPGEWDQAYQKLDDRDSACGELKSNVESELKRSDANIAILNWIRNRSEDPEPVHETVKERTGINNRKSMAGNWFLETPEFSSWIDGIRQKEAVKSVFWLKGARTGKTTLICRAISHFEDFPIDGVRFVRYYCYSSKTGKESKSPGYETIIRALCYRLAWNRDGSVAEPAIDLHDQAKQGQDSPSTKTWETLLKSLITSSSTPIVFVIDALDECKTQYDYIRLLKFLSGLLQTSVGLHCLISSQSHMRVGDYFHGSVQMFDVVQPRTEEDMRRFIKDQIESKREDPQWKKSIFFEHSALCNRLRLALFKSAGGMFRWVEIWLSVFFPKNKKPVRSLNYAKKLLDELEGLKSLDKLPDREDDKFSDNENKEAIKAAYERLWNINGDDQYKDLQVRVFQIITGARESLTPEQLLEFALSDPRNNENFDLDELEGLYCNFLEMNSEGYLDFVHLSARIFVFEMKEKGFGTSDFSPESFLARSCLRYLSVPHFESGFCHTDEEFEERLRSYPLYLYAARNWGHHARQASIPIPEVIDFLECKPKMEASSQALMAKKHYPNYSNNLYSSQEVPRRMTGLHLAAYFGVQEAVSDLLDSPSKNLKDSYGRTPLSWAAGNGHDVVVKLLLEKGAELEIKDNISGRTPLSYAAERGHEAVVKLLLKHGAKLETKGNVSGQTPLSYAAERGHEAVVKLLLEKDAKLELETKDNLFGQTPLSWAAWNGHEAVVKLLLKNGAKLETKDNISGQTPLSWAAGNGHEAVVKLLLKNGANLETKDNDSGQTPLSYAAERGHEAVVKLLLKNGANLETKDNDSGQTPLSYAAERGHEAVVKLLLKNGAKLETKDNISGQTPLSRAAGNGHEVVVKLLLKNGANLETKDNDSGQTPLSYAAERGHEAVVKLLLKNGAKLETKDTSGRTPLSWAVEGGHEAVVKLLRSRKPNDS